MSGTFDQSIVTSSVMEGPQRKLRRSRYDFRYSSSNEWFPHRLINLEVNTTEIRRLSYYQETAKGLEDS